MMTYFRSAKIHRARSPVGRDTALEGDVIAVLNTEEGLLQGKRTDVEFDPGQCVREVRVYVGKTVESIAARRARSIAGSPTRALSKSSTPVRRFVTGSNR